MSGSPDSLLVDWSQEQFASLEERILLARHRLFDTGLFSDEGLVNILDAHPEADMSINTMGATLSRRDWREGRRNGLPAEEMLQLVQRGRLWINLRKVLVHHAELRDVVTRLYDELEIGNPKFSAEQRSANLLISSPDAKVLYHLDTPVNMLWHLRGRKRVWVYPPFDFRFVPQQTLEGVISAELPEEIAYDPDFDQHAQVFDVEPGQLLTWPQFTPHRVENLEGLNVSLSTEHKNARAVRRLNVHLCNQWLRRTIGCGFGSADCEGLAARGKQLLIRVVRKLQRAKEAQHTCGNVYPISFELDPAMPSGFRLLDDAGNCPIESDELAAV